MLPGSQRGYFSDGVYQVLPKYSRDRKFPLNTQTYPYQPVWSRCPCPFSATLYRPQKLYLEVVIKWLSGRGGDRWAGKLGHTKATRCHPRILTVASAIWLTGHAVPMRPYSVSLQRSLQFSGPVLRMRAAQSKGRVGRDSSTGRTFSEHRCSNVQKLAQHTARQFPT